MSDTRPTPAVETPAEPEGRGPSMGRRAAIAGAGVAAVGLVAACSSGGSGDAAGGQPATDQPAADLPEGAPGTVLGPVSSVPVGGGVVFADQQVVVTQPAAGRFQGLSTVCPHQGCQVNAIRDGAVICPCHGSRFGLDGAVLEGPATTPLARRAVAVSGQNVTLA
ncbi:Rieske Fe-S protein [Pseudonocardia sediminis]|uniref:Cytochrome bc1 complex Rieske iron-sulfur subunit n=1 Tax=Pseudonocardia sediminis TaxID=1397368 RepID=A0A4Q7UX74_PSEST|nr:Rieske (2Fe-2S) protein [Pseudonocardia sediminis]RZT84719.1 Rieske Fe-S protein [Pseudonocardia sediminis]